MGFLRWLLPIVLGTAAAITVYIFYRAEKPFYSRIKKRKRFPYMLHNPQTRDSTIVADLVHGKSRSTFNLTFLNEEIIHLQITDPLNRRYVVKDVVTMKSDVNSTDMKMREANYNLYINYKSLKIIIMCDDFQLLMYKDDEMFLALNSQNLFTMEEKEPQVAVAFDFLFWGASKSYGLPQHADKLSLKSTENRPYRFYNTDRFAYSASDPQESLYGAVPVLYAYGLDQTTGVLWLNASETFVDIAYTDIGVRSAFFSESGVVDCYLLSGPSLQDCVRQNSQLTGSVPLPPFFALGYHQCRFSYMSQDEVIQVSNKFEENHLPLDSLWIDIDYTDEMKYFTWNPQTYPNPTQLLDFLKSKKRKAVVIIDPHIKVDDGYFVYSECKKGDYFVKTPKNRIFTAKCWPGASAWIDFLNPKARQFYASLHKEFVKSPIMHIWNDMNEPALFETKENSMAKNALHYDNWKHRDVHNLYGFYQTKATYEGLVKSRPDLRPFILTRSHFAGSQRFAAIWTGDNVATWDHLRISIPMCLTASLAGFSLCGADIGGFVKHPDDELLLRWYQLGAWIPFFRGHSNRTVPRREPYVYDEHIQTRIRNTLQQRYRHLLYWYTLFWQHYISLEPVMRPLIYQYPNDEEVVDLDHQFLIGSNILVCPVVDPEVRSIRVYLPGNELWYLIDEPFKNNCRGTYLNMSVNLDSVPVFYRGGSIIPIVEHPVQSSLDILNKHHITLYIFCNKQGNATGSLYTDDGQSFQYLKNQYHHIRFDLKNSKISNFRINNSIYHRPVILNSIKLFGYERNVQSVTLSSAAAERVIAPIEDSNFLFMGGLDVDVQEKFTITLF